MNTIIITTQNNFKYLPPNKSTRLRPVLPPTVLYIEKLVLPLLAMDTYLYCNWDRTGTVPEPPVYGGTIFPMKHYVIHDTIGDHGDLMIHEKSDRQLIVGKVSRRKAQNYKSSQNKTRMLLVAIPSVSPNQKRGKKNNGVNSNYCFQGYRKEPLESGKLGQYCFKKNSTDTNRRAFTEGLATLVHQMEEMGHTLIHWLG